MKGTETNSTRKTRKKCIKKGKVVDRYAIRVIIKVYKETHVLKQTRKPLPQKFQGQTLKDIDKNSI